MIVAHRIQLLPNNKQITYFMKACGVSRFAWNWGLAEWDRQFRARSPAIIDDYGIIFGYETKKPVDDYGVVVQPISGLALKKQFSEMIDTLFPWMRETTSYAYQQVFSDLQQAYQRYFKKLAEKPRFKSKGKSRDSFYLANTCISINARHVKIQKLGNVRMSEDLRFNGKIMSARISRDADRWMISIAVEIPDITTDHNQQTVAVGVDFGVKVMSALSTGEIRENPRALSRHEKKLKRLQRKLSRQIDTAKTGMGITKDRPFKKGERPIKSNRMKATQLKIQRVHRDISGIRSNAQHQLSSELTKRFGVIAIEDLSVKGMTASAKGDAENPGKRVAQKSGLNRGILDVGFGELRRQLDYKAKRTGSQLVVINRWFPSSKTCSSCGVVQESMPLNIRELRCTSCGTTHDRDINAARNIKKAGIAVLSEPAVKKVIKRIGKRNPTRKKVSSQDEDTVGATGI